MMIRTVLMSLMALFLFQILSCSEQAEKKSPYKKIDSPQVQVPSEEAKAIFSSCNSWFDSSFQSNPFSGEMIVAKNGQVIFEKYKGTIHWGAADSINANTPIHIASTTKTFTAMAVLKLWQEGKIKLESLFSDYFPNFNYPGVTIKSLLSHRSGLPNYLYFFDQLHYDPKQPIFNVDVLNCLINRKSEIKGTEKPNLRFNYCNTNYVLLALLIEKVTGISYPDYVQQSFFIPLDMQHSFVFTLRDTIRMTPSFDVKHQLYPLTNMDFTYGDKNIYSTAKDLLKWDQGIRNGAVVNQQTLDSAFTPQNHEKPGVKNYGLGWRMIITPNGKKVIYHNGWWHGNNSVFMRLPDENATIILIGNVYNRKIYSARELIPVFNQNYLETETSD